MARTFAEIISAEQLEMSTEKIQARGDIPLDDWSKSANHFACTFRFYGRGAEMNSRRLMTFYSMGSALKGYPKREDILSSLASDARSIRDNPTFEEWASNFGYDSDSRKAEKIYFACQAQYVKLRAFLGAALFEEVISIDPE